MKCQPVRSSFKSLALGLLIIGLGQSIYAKDTWTTVHSRDFTLVGNASEKDIRLVATRLEQFRAVFAALFPTVSLNSSPPTTVIVFKNDLSFRPYKPHAEDSGFFQAGQDVNYIALTTEHGSTEHPLSTIFHEYAHLLMNASMGPTVPLWFNEGVAEYYSTFDVMADERRFLIGNLIADHILYLRRNPLLPLHSLFAVDYKSAYYNEADKTNIFYAESWMFVHYLFQADNQKHRPQLTRFLELLRARAKIEDAFQQAFQSSVESVEINFKNYIQASKFMAETYGFNQKLDFSSQITAAPLSEADAHAYLGDLLAHMQRVTEAEAEFQHAFALEPESLLAHTALGMMCVRQGRMDDARPHLEKALQGNSESYLLHYYYAYSFSNLNWNEHQVVANYPEEVAMTMRRELNKVIALKPDYPESYWLLGFVNLVRNEQIDESLELLQKGLSVTSSNHRVLFMLAQLYLRKERFTEARELLLPIAQNSDDADLRDQAAVMAAAIQRAEEQRARIKDELQKQAPVGVAASDAAKPPTSAPVPDDPNVGLADALRTPRAGEKRIQGMLTVIDCGAKGITFQVRSGSQLLKFHSDNFDRTIITTFTMGIEREIRCGPRKPENSVVVTYTAGKAGAKFDGEATVIEFVPQSFVLKQ